MKKLIFALALLCSLQAAYAQKKDADVQKAVDRALEATQDAKKAAKPATWIKLGDAYYSAYTTPTADIPQGAIDKATFSMVHREKPRANNFIVIEGKNMEKVTYGRMDVYFTEAGQLSFVDLKSYSVPGDVLWEAAQAYSKAYGLSTKAKEQQSISLKMKEIENRYVSDAEIAHALGKMGKSSDKFLRAVEVSQLPGSAEVNATAVFNTAYTAFLAKKYDRAREYYGKCLESGHQRDGYVYYAIAECALIQKDTLAAKDYLVNGMTAFPSNGDILSSLINLSIQTKESPETIVTLLDEAKTTMPDNASLWLVEGNIYAGAKNFEKAKEAYRIAVDKDAKYDLATYNYGYVCLQQADALLPAINEAESRRDWKEADAINDQRLELVKEAIPFFEKTYEITTDAELKASSAQLTTSLYFQLRAKGAEYKEGYEKWDAIVKAGA